MLADGSYIAWFGTKLGQGTGRVLLKDGKISGSDAFITYGGSYHVDGTRFTARLTTRRHAEGQPSVFGVDEVEILLTGTATGNYASCSGELEPAPGLLFEVTLIPVKEETVKQAVTRFNPEDFHPEKLPKGKFR
jgi:hypothetical protein